MTDTLIQKLKDHQIDEKLIQHMEKNIYPKYANVDPGHQMPHIEQVINRSIDFADHCRKKLNLDLNINMVYAIAGYHDVGLSQAPREVHEQESAKIFKEDTFMKNYFSEKDFQTAADAIEDHRASLEGDPRSIYGKIVSQADRCYTDFSNYLMRCYNFRVNKPGFDTIESIAKDAHSHLIDKFGRNGYSYSKVWFPDANLDKFKQDAFNLLDEPEDIFIKKFDAKIKTKLALEKLNTEKNKIDKINSIKDQTIITKCEV